MAAPQGVSLENTINTLASRSQESEFGLSRPLKKGNSDRDRPQLSERLFKS
jgi:hypothetical protein